MNSSKKYSKKCVLKYEVGAENLKGELGSVVDAVMQTVPILFGLRC